MEEDVKNLTVSARVQMWWASPVFWSILFTQVIAIITALNGWTFIGITADSATKVAAAIVIIIGAIVNGINNAWNPTGIGPNTPTGG